MSRPDSEWKLDRLLPDGTIQQDDERYDSITYDHHAESWRSNWKGPGRDYTLIIDRENFLVLTDNRMAEGAVLFILYREKEVPM